MSLAVTGQLSSPAYGLRMDLYPGQPETPEFAEVYPFGKDGGELFVVDVRSYNPALPGQIGTAALHSMLQAGAYEGMYNFGDAELHTWGHRGIMTTAMRVLLQRVVEQDIHAQTVDFYITPPDNAKSIGLATKLGAVLQPATTGNLYRLPLKEVSRV